jgi:hypothetical protein
MAAVSIKNFILYTYDDRQKMIEYLQNIPKGTVVNAIVVFVDVPPPLIIATGVAQPDIVADVAQPDIVAEVATPLIIAADVAPPPSIAADVATPDIVVEVAPPPIIVADVAPPPSIVVEDVAPPPIIVADVAPPPIIVVEVAPPPSIAADVATPDIVIVVAPPPSIAADVAPPIVAKQESSNFKYLEPYVRKQQDKEPIKVKEPVIVKKPVEVKEPAKVVVTNEENMPHWKTHCHYFNMPTGCIHSATSCKRLHKIVPSLQKYLHAQRPKCSYGANCWNLPNCGYNHDIE